MGTKVNNVSEHCPSINVTRVRVMIQGGFRVELSFFECVAEVRDSPNSFKILSHHDDNGNVLNITSMDIDLFDTNLLDEI
jgi:hypothetical protein